MSSASPPPPPPPPLLVSVSAFNQVCFCLAVFFNDIIYDCKRTPQCAEEAKLREEKQKGRRTIKQASIITSNRILLRCFYFTSSISRAGLTQCLE